MFLVSSCSSYCPIHWNQVLSKEWGCTDRRCSNYIWVINNFITYWGVSYIRGFTVDWDCLSCNGLWVHVTGGNFHCFSEATGSPLVICLPLVLCKETVKESNRHDKQSHLVTHRGCREIWEVLVLRTSNMASTLVRNQMCTSPRWIKLICAIIICSSIGRMSSDSHLSVKAKIAFQAKGHPFPRPLNSLWPYDIISIPG